MFYKTYPLGSFFEEAGRMDKEQELLFSYLPEEYRRMQKKVELTCDRMEYEGSRMYDVYPDGHMIRQTSGRILKELEEEQDPFWSMEQGSYQQDMVCCFLCNEIFRRRHKNWMAKRYLEN